MAITKIVQGNGDGAPMNIGARIGWFVVIWTLSTAVFFCWGFFIAPDDSQIGKLEIPLLCRKQGNTLKMFFILE